MLKCITLNKKIPTGVRLAAQIGVEMMNNKKALNKSPNLTIQSKSEMLKLCEGITAKALVATLMINSGIPLTSNYIAESLDIGSSSASTAIDDLIRKKFAVIKVKIIEGVKHYQIESVIRKVQIWSDERVIKSRTRKLQKAAWIIC